MIKAINIAGYILVLLMLLMPRLNAGDHRLTISVADVTVTSNDSLIAVPVYISNPIDTLAGASVYFKIITNRYIYFASDDIRSDGMLIAADTAGSIMSGWEWIGVSSLDNDVYDLKIAGMADWPDQIKTAPAAPSEGALLVTLYFWLDDVYPVEDSTRIDINIEMENTGFSDPVGNSIGIVRTNKKICQEYAGETCVSWKKVPVVGFDTTIVKFKNGSVTIVNDQGTGP